MRANKKYIGVADDLLSGITPTGNIVRDAWVFGLLPETETDGWMRHITVILHTHEPGPELF